MVSAFLGSLIILERAVALKHRWMYLGTILSGLGGVWLILGLDEIFGQILLLIGSLFLVAIMGVIFKMQSGLHTGMMLVGAGVWAVGNMLWILGQSIPDVVYWWIGFLVFTIGGERIELSQIARPPRWANWIFGIVSLFLIVGISSGDSRAGIWMTGFGFVGLAGWLLRFDIARKTIRQTGLPRYAAVGMLLGYVWLTVGGALSLVYRPVTAGPFYDAILHSFFLGFVISMVFAHGPMIFPAILGFPFRFNKALYFPLGLLHLSLLARIIGDVALNPELRKLGAMFNAVSILLFFGVMAGSLLGKRDS